MIRLAPLFVLATMPLPAVADTLPELSPANPRIQTLVWNDGEVAALTALPQTGLTVMLLPGETITRITSSDVRSFDIRVSHDRDSFLVLPREGASGAALSVETDAREYLFSLRVGTDLTAAYLVRFETPAPS